jgi:flagellar hook-associated protein FlgK
MPETDTKSDRKRRRAERAEQLAQDLEDLYARLDVVQSQIAKELHEGGV